ncbi:hypothetical protein PROPEN_00518 [Proteus penneri ATCC 35198]|nr:hypothetical protein PROPEN_00518 [Proteus penneri ATCC 35198]
MILTLLSSYYHRVIDSFFELLLINFIKQKIKKIIFLFFRKKRLKRKCGLILYNQ